MASDTNKVITGEVRFSYVNIFHPNKDGKYSISILIPKSDKKTIKRIEKAIQVARDIDGGDKLGNRKNIKLPLRDGDTDRDDKVYAGHYFINASSRIRPGVVDRNLEEILDEEMVYSGCYGKASITFYAYNVEGNRGIAAGLNNIQFTSKGKRLDNRVSAAREFDVYTDDDEDDDDIF